MRNRRPLPLDLLLGAASGAAATWVMDVLTTALMDRQPKEVTAREERARDGKNAYETAAEKAASLAGRELTEAQRKTAGLAVHWTLGVGSGIAYGALRHTFPRLGLGSGLAYGTIFWLAMDEAALTLLGVAPPPDRFPWQTHARGLAGHLALGAAIEAAFDLADLAE
jgi:hypothetical protein